MHNFNLLRVPLFIACAIFAFTISHTLYMAFAEWGIIQGLLMASGLWVAPGVFAFSLERSFGYPMEARSTTIEALSAAWLGWLKMHNTAFKLLKPPQTYQSQEG